MDLKYLNMTAIENRNGDGVGWMQAAASGGWLLVSFCQWF